MFKKERRKRRNTDDADGTDDADLLVKRSQAGAGGRAERGRPALEKAEKFVPRRLGKRERIVNNQSLTPFSRKFDPDRWNILPTLSLNPDVFDLPANLESP